MFTKKIVKGLALIAVSTLSAATFVQTASAGCGGEICNGGSATLAPVSAYESSYSSGSQYVPHSSSVSTSSVSNLSIPGFGANERLCPTTCPVDVYNPEGGQVMGCYNVCKPVAPAPVQVVQPPMVTPITVMNQVRVIRPIVAVPYPVPTPVFVPAPRPIPMPMPMPMPACGMPVPICY